MNIRTHAYITRTYTHILHMHAYCMVCCLMCLAWFVIVLLCIFYWFRDLCYLLQSQVFLAPRYHASVLSGSTQQWIVRHSGSWKSNETNTCVNVAVTCTLNPTRPSWGFAGALCRPLDSAFDGPAASSRPSPETCKSPAEIPAPHPANSWHPAPHPALVTPNQISLFRLSLPRFVGSRVMGNPACTW